MAHSGDLFGVVMLLVLLLLSAIFLFGPCELAPPVFCLITFSRFSGPRRTFVRATGVLLVVVMLFGSSEHCINIIPKKILASWK